MYHSRGLLTGTMQCAAMVGSLVANASAGWGLPDDAPGRDEARANRAGLSDPGLTQAQRFSLLDQAARDTELSNKLEWSTTDKAFSLRIGLHAQYRYNANFRDGSAIPDGNTHGEFTHGGQIRRAKLSMSGKVADDKTSYKVTLAASKSTGLVSVEGWTLSRRFDGGLSITVGQTKLPLLREYSVSSRYQLAVDRSQLSSVYSQSYSQQIAATYTADRLRVSAAFSDGIKTTNKDFIDPAEADYALTGRVETRLGEAPFKQYTDFTAFPGDEFGVLIGIAGHTQDGGHTGLGTMNTQITIITADISAEGDGWNAFASGVWRRTDAAGADSFDDYGILAQAGVFVTNDTELFARWSTIFPDTDRTGGSDSYSTLTGGANYYVIPASHAITISGDVQYMFDAQASSASIIKASTSINQLADTSDGQVAARLQLEFIF